MGKKQTLISHPNRSSIIYDDGKLIDQWSLDIIGPMAPD